MNDNTIEIYLKLRDEATKQLQAFSKQMQGFSNSMQGAFSKIASFSQSALNVVKSGLQQTAEFANRVNVGLLALGTAFAGAGAMGINMAGDLQMIQGGLATLLKSEKEAVRALDLIKKDAARTPFDLREVARANQMLISTGLGIDESRKAVLALGNAVVATGGSNEQFSRMISNLQQMKNVGQATEMDMRQFGYAGINIYKLLEEATGKSVASLKEMTITYDMVVDALEKAQGKGGSFAGALERQGNSWNLLKSNLKDVVNILLADIVTDTGLFGYLNTQLLNLVNFLNTQKSTIVGFFKTVAKTAQEELQKLVKELKPLGDWVMQNRVAIIDFFKGFGVSLVTLYVIGNVVKLLTALTNPILLVALAIGLLYVAWSTNFLGIKDITANVFNFLQSVFSKIVIIAQDLKNKWDTDFGNIRTITTTTLAVLKTGFEVWVSALKTTIKIIKALVDKDYKTAWSALLEHTDNVIISLKKNIGVDLPKIFESASNKISEQINIIDTRVTDFGSSMNKSFKNSYDTATKQLENFSKNYKQILTNLLIDALIAMVEYDINTITNWGRYFIKLQKEIERGFEEIKKTITDKFTGWGLAVQDFFNTLPFYFITGFINLTITIGNWFTQEKINIEKKLQEWRISFETWLNNLPSVFIFGLINAGIAIFEWLEQMKVDFTKWWGGLGKQASEELAKGFSFENTTTAGKIVGGILLIIGIVLATLVIGFIDLGIRAIVALGVGITRGWNALRNLVIQKVNELIKSVGDAFMSIKDAPGNAMKALYDNVVGWMNTMYNKVTEIAKNIGRSIADAFNKDKKHSPSIMDRMKETVEAVNYQMRQFEYPQPLAHSPYFDRYAYSGSGNTYNQPININANINSNMDMDLLSYKLAWELRNSK